MIGRRPLTTLAALAVLAFAGSAARAQQTLRDELMVLERAIWEALKERDRAAMRRLLADDAVLIDDDGTRYYKSEMLDHMTNYRLDSYRIEPTYAVRMLSADVAALHYRVISRGAERFDRTTTDKVLVSSVYVRRDGKWRIVLYQETPLK
jgi:uncharacterized protein (TIGR02246 family)